MFDYNIREEQKGTRKIFGRLDERSGFKEMGETQFLFKKGTFGVEINLSIYTCFLFKNQHQTLIMSLNMNAGNKLAAPAAAQQDLEVSYEDDPNNTSTIADDQNYQERLPEFNTNLKIIDLNPNRQQSQGSPKQNPFVHFELPQARPHIVVDEGEPGMLRRHNSPEVGNVKHINNELNSKQADLAFFWEIWNSPQREQFIKGLEFVVHPDNWPVYRVEFHRPLELFLTIYENKLSKVLLLGKLYPGLEQLVSKIAATVEFSLKGVLRTEERTSMALYEHYINEIESRCKQEGAFYIRDESDPNNPLKIPISDFIASSPVFERNRAWANIFLSAGIQKLKEIQSQPAGSQEIEAQLKKLKENRKILRQRVTDGDNVLPPENHPCCAQFLYFNFRVHDPVVSICPVLTERRIAGLKEDSPGDEIGLVLLDICALLNSGGGVLLFDTLKSYLQLWPKGDLLDDNFYKSIRQRFAEELRSIHPPVRLDEHIILSRVPVVRNPITDGLASSGRNYIQGLYVLRVVVKPREEGAEQVYIYLKDNSQRMQVAILENGARRLLSGMEGLRYMKRKFNYFYVPEKDYRDEEEYAMLRRPYSLFIDHPNCLEPEQGIRTTANFSSVKGPQNKPEQDLETRYKYLTLLVATRANHGTILQRLHAKGIQCQIAVKYLKYHFKAANNSAALFHNVRFDQLLSEVAYKKDFEFNGRFILTILVTPFIRLTNKNRGNLMSEEEFETLRSWLKTEHPNETLTVWRVVEEGQKEGKKEEEKEGKKQGQSEKREEWEFYLQTGGKLSMLFMYYVLNHYGEKCSFKNPKNYEKMTQEERERKLIKFYPRK